MKEKIKRFETDRLAMEAKMEKLLAKIEALEKLVDGKNVQIKKKNKVKIMTEIQTVHSDSRTAENISLLNYSKSENKNESVWS